MGRRAKTRSLYLHNPHKLCAHSLELNAVIVAIVAFVHPLCRLWVHWLSLPHRHCSEWGGNENLLEDTSDMLEYETGFVDSVTP